MKMMLILDAAQGYNPDKIIYESKFGITESIKYLNSDPAEVNFHC